MPPLALLLRGLLCIVLILNGSGSAVAATQMQMAHGLRAAAEAAEEALEPCRQHTGVANRSHERHATPADTGTSNLPHGASQHCEPSGCDCACVHHVPAMSMAQMRVPVMHRSRSVRAMTAGHAAPVLPHLLRPPIG